MLREASTEERVGDLVAEEADPMTASTSMAVDPLLERQLLRAVETYKAVCAATGQEPSEEETWLVFLGALRAAGQK